jgi:hypothetical protein
LSVFERECPKIGHSPCPISRRARRPVSDRYQAVAERLQRGALVPWISGAVALGRWARSEGGRSVPSSSPESRPEASARPCVSWQAFFSGGVSRLALFRIRIKIHRKAGLIRSAPEVLPCQISIRSNRQRTCKTCMPLSAGQVHHTKWTRTGDEPAAR